MGVRAGGYDDTDPHPISKTPARGVFLRHSNSRLAVAVTLIPGYSLSTRNQWTAVTATGMLDLGMLAYVRLVISTFGPS